jgi:hypothetical protein
MTEGISAECIEEDAESDEIRTAAGDSDAPGAFARVF